MPSKAIGRVRCNAAAVDKGSGPGSWRLGRSGAYATLVVTCPQTDAKVAMVASVTLSDIYEGA